MNSHQYIVIMAGGRGTRLWPLSRNASPKQLQKIIGELTLIRETFQRVVQIVPADNIYISTNDDYSPLIQKELPEIPKQNFITEPIAKNTAPAIGLATIHILERDSKAIICTTHADHLVAKSDNYVQAIRTSIKMIEKHPSMIGTVGIKPEFAHTGLGYIKRDKKLETINGQEIYYMNGFKEKPDQQTAQKYINSGKYSWNAGYYSYKASTMMEAIKKHEPEIYERLINIKKSIGKKNYTQTKKKNFQTMPSIAIDYISERLDNAFTITADLGWNDIGSWKVIHEILSKKTKQTNITRGNVLSIDNKDCLIYAKEKLIAATGLKDIIIVDSNDAILICDRKKSQNVKNIIEKMQEDKKYHKYL